MLAAEGEASPGRLFGARAAPYGWCVWRTVDARGRPSIGPQRRAEAVRPPKYPCCRRAREDLRLLLEALRSVPLECQVILELYFWERLSSPQIADVLGVGENTARTRLRRARIRVGETLERLSRSPALLKSTLVDLESWVRSMRPAPA